MKVNKRVLRSDNIMRTFFAASVVSFATTMVALGWVVSNPPQMQVVKAITDTSKVKVSVDTLISLAVNDEVKISVSPEDVAAGTLKTNKATVSVSTNTNDGYILYISDKDDNTYLVNTQFPSQMIQALSQNVTGSASSGYSEIGWAESNFAVNRWGYRVDDETNYHGITVGRTKIKDTHRTVAAETTELTFGVKVDVTKAAGDYQDVVVLSAVPSSTESESWDTATTMQGFSQAACASAPISGDIGPSKQLLDIRDGQSYYVSRLKDGNCWMTQNLALNLSTETQLTIENTDLNSNEAMANNGWTPSRTTPVLQTSGKWASDGSDGDHSYSFGDRIYFINDESAGASSKTYNSVAECMTAVGDRYESNAAAEAACTHYKAGILYNWTAATAGSGMRVADGGIDAEDSICPRGWQLPVDGDAKKNKSWNNLTSYYVGTSDKTYHAEQAPLYLVRSGYYNYSNGSLGYQTSHMYYWSSTAASNTSAKNLVAYSNNNWYPQDSYGRGRGFSVRCVLR